MIDTVLINLLTNQTVVLSTLLSRSIRPKWSDLPLQVEDKSEIKRGRQALAFILELIWRSNLSEDGCSKTLAMLTSVKIGATVSVCIFGIKSQ